MSIRAVKSIVQSQPVLEGAGVKLRRAFGFGKTTDFDPFLLLDDFRNEHPEDYLPGFPCHPHRGIETIAYVLSGSVQHGDSLGNSGTMTAGDVQWMTAGSGILHQEMPKGDERGRMHGFQLWANLPRNQKMTDPRYQDIHSKDIPEVVDDDGTRVRVVAGDFWGKQGPVEGVAADPRYLDVWIPPRVRQTIPVESSRHAFPLGFEGEGTAGGARGRGWPPIRVISTSGFRRACARRFRSRARGTPSRTSSRATARSATPRRRRACGPIASRTVGATRAAKRRPRPGTVRSCCSSPETKSRSKQESGAFGFSSSRAGRSRSRSRGRGRSS